MSATRPATEFSIGIMPRSASPEEIAASASSKVGQGRASASGYASAMAIWELAPGSPWNAIFMVLVVLVMAPCISRSGFGQSGGRQRGGFDIRFSAAASSQKANVKSKTALESNICSRPFGSGIRKQTRRGTIRMSEPGREYLARGFEVGRGVDAARHGVDNCDVDPHAGLERPQLFQLFLLLQRRGGEADEALQRRTAIGVEPDVMVARPVAMGRGGAGKIKCA